MILRDPDLDGDLELAIGRFRLRPVEDADIRDLFDHLADPRVVEFMDFEPLTDLEHAGDIIAWARAQRAAGAGVRWAVRERSGAFVGTCGFNRIDLQRGRRGEIAYDLGHTWWGRGVMSEILQAVIAFGFGRLALHRLEAMVTPGNGRSGRLLQRLGFTPEGVLRDHGFWKGRYWDQVLYARLAPDGGNLVDRTAGGSEGA